MRTLPEIFGDTVRRLRKKVEPSQEKFAARAGISRTYMSEIERGVTNVSLETIERLANGLGLPLADLFCEVDAERGNRIQTKRKSDL